MTFEEQLSKEENPAIIKIGNYLKDRATKDPSVERTIKKDNKTLKECWNYILGEISKNIYREGNFGVAAGDDQVLYDLAVHYYDEDEIEIKKADWIKVNTKMDKKTPKKVQKEENQEQDVQNLKHQQKRTKKKNQPKNTTEQQHIIQTSLF